MNAEQILALLLVIADLRTKVETLSAQNTQLQSRLNDQES